MDSRINENPARTFDLALQVACPSSENEDPTVLWKFPQDFGDQEVLQTVPKFCFPFDVERVSQTQVGQHFTFVLTDIESKQRFGFCRLTSGCRVCICLLSYLPWFEIYYKLLNTLADYLSKHQEDDLNDMLETLHTHPVPKPNTPVNLSVHSYFIAPDINGLPTIPENRNLTEYFVAVDVNNMLHLYASMLHERRIIITSSKLSTVTYYPEQLRSTTMSQNSTDTTTTTTTTLQALPIEDVYKSDSGLKLISLKLAVVPQPSLLTACVHGSTAMLYPMHWQHIFIPVLPPHLLDYCCAPMPYLVGVHLSLLERVKSRSLEDVVILNVDTNTLESPTDDLHNLPSDVVSSLKSKLKKQSTATGSGVARAFLHAQAALFGSYRDALRYKPGEPITFCEKSFVAHRSSTMRSFLEMAVNLQLFKQFIEGRLAKLNAGRGFTDVYEEEITEGRFCRSNSRSYQQWIHTKMRQRAKPVVKNLQMAKDHAKRKIRDMKDKITQKDAEEEESPYCAGSPTSTKSLSPRRLQRKAHQNPKSSPHMSLCFPDGYNNDNNDDAASRISSEDSGEVASYNEDSDDSDLEFQPEVSQTGQMNLLEEILDSLSTSNIEQGRLYAAKSLDFFRSIEDLEYNTTKNSKSPLGSSPAQVSSEVENGEQGGWNMGQDDSAVHGKHLPPSPRRQVSSCSLPVRPPFPNDLANEENQRNSLPETPQVQLSVPCDTEKPSSSQLSPDNRQPTTSCSLSRQKVLSRKTQRPSLEHAQQKAASGQPSVLVPWEREKQPQETNMEERGNETQEKGLLEEIESMCHVSMALKSNQELTHIRNNTSLDKS
ncbi:DENN domain-containing protein 1B isoform X2 [Puntigrus tetrazona]|uniref:DENN domain-containing protein 1B isoform X2 n=2 Tax=Puntigrus tetrazona TaxID=1606681 RepID=UPI001C8A68AD|nr:DENN domain-containing protein 1B isoform X2 [Puntigrus tetrazona]